MGHPSPQPIVRTEPDSPHTPNFAHSTVKYLGNTSIGNGDRATRATCRAKAKRRMSKGRTRRSPNLASLDTWLFVRGLYSIYASLYKRLFVRSLYLIMRTPSTDTTFKGLKNEQEIKAVTSQERLHTHRHDPCRWDLQTHTNWQGQV